MTSATVKVKARFHNIHGQMTTGLTGVKHEGYTREHTRESTVSQKGSMITFGVSMVPLDVYVIPLDVYRA